MISFNRFAPESLSYSGSPVEKNVIVLVVYNSIVLDAMVLDGILSNCLSHFVTNFCLSVFSKRAVFWFLK